MCGLSVFEALAAKRICQLIKGLCLNLNRLMDVAWRCSASERM